MLKKIILDDKRIAEKDKRPVKEIEKNYDFKGLQDVNNIRYPLPIPNFSGTPIHEITLLVQSLFILESFDMS